MFLERISATGMQNNKFWYNNQYNKGAGTSNALPNCTCFCVGEAYEVTENDEPMSLFKYPYDRTGAFPTAKDFYSLWNGKKGIEPKIGGIAVWGTSGNGHVAVVLTYEDVGTKGAKIKVCQSNFRGKYFEVKEYIVKKGAVTEGVGLVYVGCCYLDVKDKRVPRNTDLLQVKVKANLLNVRNKPNGTIYAGRKCPNGIYTILDMKRDGEYVWAMLDENYWIALNDEDGWTETYQPTTNVTLEQKYNNLLVAYDTLSWKYSELVSKYEKETGKKA